MRYLLLSVQVIFMFACFNLMSQARLIFNDDVYVTMSGGTAITPIYVVVDNPEQIQFPLPVQGVI